MIEEILDDANIRMMKSVESMSNEFNRIRTGRASPALLDQIMIEYYGSRVPIAQAATVGIADARTITIQAWEKQIIPVIEKAILESDLGLNPTTAGEVIRINIPALTEERRKEMTKMVRNEGENGKIAVRNIRRDAIGDLRDLVKEGIISQDEEKRSESRLEEITKQNISEIDKKVSTKENEVMEV